MIVAFMVIFTLLFFSFIAFAAQQPDPTFQFQSVDKQDINNTIDTNGNPIQLPFSPKAEAYVFESDGNKIPIHYKATHKLLGKTSENRQTTYSMQSDVDASVLIKRVGTQQNLLSFIAPLLAYADGSNYATGQNDYVTMHQRYYLM